MQYSIASGSIRYRPSNGSREAMCDGKRPLRWVDAKAILDRPRRRKQVAYHCPVCRAWHVGNPMRKGRQ